MNVMIRSAKSDCLSLFHSESGMTCMQSGLTPKGYAWMRKRFKTSNVAKTTIEACYFDGMGTFSFA